MRTGIPTAAARPARGFARARPLAAAAAAAAAVTGGCVYVPVTAYTFDHRSQRPIHATDVRSMEPGRTTRADVVARLGPPTDELPNAEGMVYAWTEHREVRLDQYWWLLRLGGYPDLFAWSPGPRLSRRATERRLVLRFGPGGTLRSADVQTGPPDRPGDAPETEGAKTEGRH